MFLRLPFEVLVGSRVENPKRCVQILSCCAVVTGESSRSSAHRDPVVAQRDLLVVDPLVGILCEEEIVRAGFNQGTQEQQVRGSEILGLVDEHVLVGPRPALVRRVVQPGCGEDDGNEFRQGSSLLGVADKG